MTNMIKFRAVGNTKQCLIIAFLMNYIKLNDINSIRYMNSEERYIDFLLNRLVSYDELAKEGVLIDGFYYNRRRHSLETYRINEITGMNFNIKIDTRSNRLICRLLNYIVCYDANVEKFYDKKDYLKYLYSKVGFNYKDLVSIGIY